MVERGYIREADQLERAVLSAARKLWGPRRIVEALSARGFERAAVEECTARLSEAGEIDFAAQRARLLSEKLAPDAPRQKRLALLYRYGYGGGES
jgi:SOS response regulatory protein OraA/RecX